MDGDGLIDGHVSHAQSRKAIAALLKHVRDEQRRLDETELIPHKPQHIWLVVTVKRMSPTKNLKPYKIPLAHPIVDPRTSSVCLITKDPQREYKDLLESHKVKFISRVVGVEKLRGKFKGFDARRMLLRENDLFLADDRVIPLLPRLLGKKWFEAKKQPIPVSLTKKALKAELEKAISSTYMHQNQGTCTSIKIGVISQKDSHVLANLTTALPAIVARIQSGWDNVQSLNIKTSNSVSLPIWTCPLDGEQPGSRWGGMAFDESQWEGFDTSVKSDDARDIEEVTEAGLGNKTPKASGKKRAVETTDNMDESAKKGTKKAKILVDTALSRIGVSGI